MQVVDEVLGQGEMGRHCTACPGVCGIQCLDSKTTYLANYQAASKTKWSARARFLSDLFAQGTWGEASDLDKEQAMKGNNISSDELLEEPMYEDGTLRKV